MNAILLASVGVAILLIGGGVGFWVGRSGVGGSKARVEKAEAELEDYKRNVTEHFGQTAAHFQAIGKQYRDLYDHMANGAQSLCEPDEAGKQLLFGPGVDTTITKEVETPAEAVADAEVHPPIDYAEEPIAEQATEAVETAAEPADEPAEISAEADSSEEEKMEGPVPETSAESKPEAKSEEVDRTIH